jgi:hypothetical protein
MIAHIVASVGLVCFLCCLPSAQAQEGANIIKEFKGEADGDTLSNALGTSSYLVGPSAFKEFCNAAGLKGDMPKVDFEKQLVLRVYSLDAKDLTMQLKLDSKGDLKVTQTAKPGDNVKTMSFHLVIISREGVNTVNGKKIVIKNDNELSNDADKNQASRRFAEAQWAMRAYVHRGSVGGKRNCFVPGR